MDDERKTKKQLINELAEMRQLSPPSKPEISDETLAKWQRIVDLMAKTVGVPAGLIMKIDPPQIEVFVASATEGNPYEKGERADLDTGLYCETVMAQRSPLTGSRCSRRPELGPQSRY